MEKIKLGLLGLDYDTEAGRGWPGARYAPNSIRNALNGIMNRMEEGVFLNEKYDDSYFECKCLLLIYHYFTEQPEFKIESVVSKDDVLTVNILKSRYANLANAPTHFVIELDKEYSGMEVELKWETKDF